MSIQLPASLQAILAEFHSDDEREIRDAAFFEKQERFLQTIEMQCQAWRMLEDAEIPAQLRDGFIARTLETFSVPLIHVHSAVQYPFEGED